jgi:hypothetical protein
MISEIKRFIDDSFNKIIPHFERTIYWLKILNPKADEAMEIAAYAHDISRAFRKTNSAETFRDKELDDREIIKEHQEKGAKIITAFLKEKHYNVKDIDRIYKMVSKHEWGGDLESDLIKDADSISYLELNAPKHAQKLALILGKEKIRRKIDWMFNRITSKEAKKLAEPFYQTAIKCLEKN